MHSITWLKINKHDSGDNSADSEWVCVCIHQWSGSLWLSRKNVHKMCLLFVVVFSFDKT